MKQLILERPSKKEEIVKLKTRGQEEEVRGIVRGWTSGEYLLRVVMDHRARETRGRVKIKGVAKNGARVRVEGVIKIAPEAQNVEDFLEIRLLILDDRSTAEAEPKLEIQANEVKASHAATVGRISEEELFYLMSRGLSRHQAEGIIVRGFLKW